MKLSEPKIFTLYWVVALLVLLHAAAPTDSVLGHLMQPLACILVVLGSIVLFAVVVTISAIPKGAYHTANAFQRIGQTNSAGEPPLPTKRRQEEEKTVVEVFTQGIPITTFLDNIDALESALNHRVTKIEPGDGKQSILLHLAPGNTKLPEEAYLPQGQLSKPPEILLGESLDGPVIWDPDKVPHLLVGGSTGSGKTTLVKSIIFQFVCMTDSDGKPAAEVYVSDLKGGLDYPVHWRNRDCSFAVTAGDTLAGCSHIV